LANLKALGIELRPTEPRFENATGVVV
jgi:hypothetical protein